MKEIERAGIPVTHLCNLSSVAKTIGSKRIYEASSIVHPTGSPDLTQDKELEFRIAMLREALQLLTTIPQS